MEQNNNEPKPCPFKKGEIVEVRYYDHEDWYLRRFSHIDEYGRYICFSNLTSGYPFAWLQCREPEPYEEVEEADKKEEDDDYDNSVIQCTKCSHYKFIGHGLDGCDIGGDYCPYGR